MTPNSWLAVVGSLAVLLAGAVYCAVTYRQRWLDLRDKSDALLSRLNRAEGSLVRQIELGTYRVPPEKAPSVLREIFRPMGAKPFPGTIPWPGLNVPSLERDALDAKAWRERRAVTASDHLRRHRVEGALTDSEAATEIMQFCVGPMEVEGE